MSGRARPSLVARIGRRPARAAEEVWPPLQDFQQRGVGPWLTTPSRTSSVITRQSRSLACGPSARARATARQCSGPCTSRLISCQPWAGRRTAPGSPEMSSAFRPESAWWRACATWIASSASIASARRLLVSGLCSAGSAAAARIPATAVVVATSTSLKPRRGWRSGDGRLVITSRTAFGCAGPGRASAGAAARRCRGPAPGSPRLHGAVPARCRSGPALLLVYTLTVTAVECVKLTDDTVPGGPTRDDDTVRDLFKKMLMSGRSGVIPVMPTPVITELARDLRWRHGITCKPMDRLHIATAMAMKSSHFFTTDDKLGQQNVAKINALGLAVCRANSVSEMLPDRYRQLTLEGSKHAKRQGAATQGRREGQRWLRSRPASKGRFKRFGRCIPP